MRFSHLVVEARDTHKWSLTEDFVLFDRCIKPRWFELGLKGDLGVSKEPFILVERGFITDFGTIPRMFWSFCSPVDIAFAAVIHDRMYQIVNNSDIQFDEKRILRKEADDVFLDALAVQPGGVPWFRSFVCWVCLRAFGWTYVNIPSVEQIKKMMKEIIPTRLRPCRA